MVEGALISGSEHAMQYPDDVLKNCTLETYRLFINQYHPNKFNKIKKERKMDGNELKNLVKFSILLFPFDL